MVMLASVSRAYAVFVPFFVKQPAARVVTVAKGCVLLDAKTIVIDDFPPHIIVTARSFYRNIGEPWVIIVPGPTIFPLPVNAPVLNSLRSPSAQYSMSKNH